MQEWTDRKVVVLGLARQGKALSQYLAKKGARVVVSDLKRTGELAAVREELAEWPIEYVLGEHPMNLLENTSVVFVSGGVPLNLPLIQEARNLGIQLSNDSQLFLELCPAPVIGITGSAGKSTTTALVGRMAELEAEGSGTNAWVGGNIGRPLLWDVEHIHPHDWVVLELSSFQLELMEASPHIAALLNLSPNHLDRHKTMETYIAAKSRIFKNQSQEDIAILSRDDPVAWDLRHVIQGRSFTFGLESVGLVEGTYIKAGWIYYRKNDEERVLCPIDAIPLRGEHNLQNVLAASAIALGAGFPKDVIEAGIRSFKGLAHRLEFVRQVHGISWYNDSIATSPDRSIAAMRSFDEPLLLLAGGRDKDLAWEEFSKVVSERVDHLILFGEAANKIAKAMAHVKGERPFTIDICRGLEDAVQKAVAVAKAGDIVLLAPGGTSFDEFVDFEARGERFKEWVEAL
ncbi:MAG: UDP-N-acetylmuramoylalanine--D-glutamate ligase [Chloroflexi bacterium RBG_16_48_8]|nr:MAG: UDP-N-acetylmuramoylalanine--D-glutamate ligase [Chloroflexi bacterium RBG_16_48_8]